VRGNESGTILLEALVALAITASVMIMWGSSIGPSAKRLRLAEERMLAMAGARSLIAELSGAHFVTPSDQTGFTADGFAWTAKFAPAEFPAPSFVVKLFRVSLQISGKDDKTPPITIETYVISRPESE
jgi:hypothetical protein